MKYPTATRPAYLPHLDGLRGWGMLLIISAHLPRPSDSTILSLLWQFEHVTKLAAVGLDTFFVLSGFLITRLILAERRRTGRISLREFYIRRSLRIFPIYTIAVIVVTIGWPTTLDRTASLLTYTYNMYLPLHPTPYPLEQSWSLAVEEQFYLLWPLLVILIPVRWLGRTTLLVIPGLAIAASLIYAASLPPTLSGALIYMSLPTRMLPIALGCYLAVVEQEGRALSLGQAALIAGAGAVLVTAASLGRATGWVPAGGWYWTLASPGVTLITFSFIVTLISPVAPRWWIAVFDFDAIRYLGSISYAGYLIHVPVLFALGVNDAALDGGSASWHYSALVLILTLALATASWFLVERPLGRLKSRLGGIAAKKAVPKTYHAQT